MQAFETTGTIDTRGQVAFDQPLPVSRPARVRMILLFEEGSSARPLRPSPSSFGVTPSARSRRIDSAEMQQLWELLADMFAEEPEEDWTQLLRTARRKSLWM